MTLLFRSETLELLSNTLSVDDKYFQENRENTPKQIQKILSKKKPMIFCQIFVAFLKCTENLKHSSKNFFKAPFGSQKVSSFKSFLKSARQNFDYSFTLLWDKLNWETTFLSRSYIFGLFFTTSTDEDKCPSHNREIILQPIEMQFF